MAESDFRINGTRLTFQPQRYRFEPPAIVGYNGLGQPRYQGTWSVTLGRDHGLIEAYQEWRSFIPTGQFTSTVTVKLINPVGTGGYSYTTLTGELHMPMLDSLDGGLRTSGLTMLITSLR